MGTVGVKLQLWVGHQVNPVKLVTEMNLRIGKEPGSGVYSTFTLKPYPRVKGKLYKIQQKSARLRSQECVGLGGRCGDGVGGI